MKENQETFAKHVNPRRIKISRLYHKIELKFPSIKIFKKLYYIKFSKGSQRYKYLFEIIEDIKCKRIMEIGTWDGEHALQMIESAKKNFPIKEIEYYGFDLFEDADEKTIDVEISKKPSLYNEIK